MPLRESATLLALYLEFFGDALHGFVNIVAAVKRRDAKITFSGGTKSRARGANDVGSVQQFVKEIPA